jgi:hypothetical protein
MAELDNQDPFEDPVETPEESIEESPEGEPEEPEAPPESTEFEGLPFKDVKALVKAYKSLQGDYTKRSQRLSEYEQNLLPKILPLLSREEKKEVKEDPEAFLQKFLDNPVAAINAIIASALNQYDTTRVSPVIGEFGQMSVNTEVDSFFAKHPELNEDDEEAFLKLIDEYPEVAVKNVNGKMVPNKDRMERYYKLLLSEKPEIKLRAKNSVGQGLNNAKKAASMGGRKASVPGQSKGDPFEDVLSLDREIMSKF